MVEQKVANHDWQTFASRSKNWTFVIVEYADCQINENLTERTTETN
jgi:hypothetical protein